MSDRQLLERARYFLQDRIRQDAMDRLLGVDGRDEFTTYMAPVGKV